MPLGGERVGTAYVKLVADGDSVPDDVRDALKRLEPTLRDAGEEHAKAYDDSFDKQIDKDSDKFRDKLDKRLMKGLGKLAATGEIIGKEVGDNLFDGIEQNLTEKLADPALARRIRTNLQSAFAVDQDLNRLKARLGDINREAIKATGQLEREQNNLQADIQRTIANTDRLVEAAKREMRAWDSTNESRLRNIRATLSEVVKGGAIMDKFDRQLKGVFIKGEEGWTRLHDKIRDSDGALVRFNHRLDEAAGFVGKASGKGSRNDLINFFGALTEGATKLAFVLPKIPGLLQGAFSGAEGGGGEGFKIGESLASAAASAIALAAGVAILAAVLGPVSALISGLAAAAIGLASSLLFAAGAAGAVAAVLAGPVIVGILGVVAALKEMDDTQKKLLKTSIKPITDAFKDFGKGVADGLTPGLQRAAKAFEPLLKNVGDFGKKVGDALGDVATHFANAVSGPGFTSFLNAFEKFIPDAIRGLGRIFTNVFTGIGGVLEAAIPTAQRFLDWLGKITRDFSKWANSRKGQNELADFFDKAADSAKAVGGFVGDLLEAIGKLAGAGKGSGDTIFDDLSKQLKKFSDYLDKNPDALRDFFKNGIDTAREVGTVILAVARAIEKMDNPGTRKFLHQFADALGVILPLIGDVVAAIFKVNSAMGKVITAMTRFASSTVRAWFKVQGKIQDVASALPRLVGRAVSAATAAFSRLASWASAKFDQIRSKGSSAIDQIASFFRSLPGRVSGALSDLAGQVAAKFNAIVDKVRDIPGQIVSLFSGLAGRILSAIGTIDIGSLIKIPSPGGGVPFVPGIATGGWFGRVTSGPMLRWVGEDGPEAIVPLDRPLSQVDPAVRGLSALAQGKAGGVSTGGTKVDASGWTIVSPGDPETVAQEVVNRVFAQAY